MMPAGRYYVGDLCYVMDSQWDEFCDLTISGNNVKDGEFQLKNGVRFASLRTMYGDGCYEDQEGNSYPVDAGLIGCILVEDITDPKADLKLGNIINFEKDFTVYSANGTLYIGHVMIETGGYDDDEEGEDED